MHRGQKSSTPKPLGNCEAFQEYETGPGIEQGTFELANECSTTELTLPY